MFNLTPGLTTGVVIRGDLTKHLQNNIQRLSIHHFYGRDKKWSNSHKLVFVVYLTFMKSSVNVNLSCLHLSL